jgi:acetyl-CoA carboxylase carboxyltransferase component
MTILEGRPRPTVQFAPGRGDSGARVADVTEPQTIRFTCADESRWAQPSGVDGYQLADAAERAHRLRVPLVFTMSASGPDRYNDVAALGGLGAAAATLVRCSGSIPIILVVDGPLTSSQALLLGLADVVVMTEQAHAYVSGPHAVATVTGLVRSRNELGGPDVHASASGVAACVVPDLEAASAWVDILLEYLPPNVDETPPMIATCDSAPRPVPELRESVPTDSKAGYDVRRVIDLIVDDAEFLELRPRWGTTMVTGFGSLAGQPIGIVANQPQIMAGTIDIPAAQKAARFVTLCDGFNLPILTVVDTPGFLPGIDLEWRGMIRHGAQLAYAYAQATVPRVALIIRKAYGGAYIVMDAKAMGNDVCMAWPIAEIAVMGAKGAVQILHRNVDAETRLTLEEEYDRTFSNPYVAAARGYVDTVIDPADTRSELIAAFTAMEGKREALALRRHGNTPL